MPNDLAASSPNLELARVTTLEELVKVCKIRRGSLGMSQLLVDDVAGMQDGYTAKLEAGMKGLGKLSIPLLLGALKLELAVVPASSQHLNSRAPAKDCDMSRENFFTRRARMARAKQLANQTPKQRQKIARAAAKARWSKVRKAEREHGR